MEFKTLLRRRLAKVDDKKMYSPKEVAELKLILNTSFEPSPHKVYRIIKRKEIPTVNMGTDTQPRWFVSGKDLRAFVEEKYLAE